jgi:hypothetical protein
MKDLIERLEKATGPDRELDGDLFARLMGWDDGKTPATTLKYAKLEASSYTGSIDAALRLVPAGGRLLELGQWDDNGKPAGWFAQVTRWIKTSDDTWTDQVFAHGIEEDGVMPKLAPNGAIALCIAALKAREMLTSQQHFWSAT